MWTLRTGQVFATRALTVTVWGLAIPALLLALVRTLGLDHGALLVQAVAFTPYAFAGALMVTAAAGYGRRWWPAALATLAALLLAPTLAPRGLGSVSAVPGTPLTVMSTNMRVGRAPPESIVDLVRERQVDVLAVQELTGPALAGLESAGLSNLLPYREVSAGSRAGGSALYSRYPLTDSGDRVASPNGYRQAFARVQVPGARPILVESVHTVPPVDDEETSRWADGLRAQLPAGRGAILVGDFNATLDHRELRRLIDTGYRDAADEVGAGFSGTWPLQGKRSWVLPPITLDHVLVPDGVYVRDFTAVTIPRTDHRGIIARLTLTRPDPT